MMIPEPAEASAAKTEAAYQHTSAPTQQQTAGKDTYNARD